MDRTEKPKASTPDPAEEAIVELLQEHIDEAASHELLHRALIAEPPAPDDDLHHADPLKEANPFAPDPRPQKQFRDVL